MFSYMVNWIRGIYVISTWHNGSFTFSYFSTSKIVVWAQTCPRQWYACLSSAFGTRGFTFSLNDYFLFFKSIDCLITIIAVYVDNILITRKNAFEISEIKIFLHNILRKRIWVWLIIS